jgi:hypothetical protein
MDDKSKNSQSKKNFDASNTSESSKATPAEKIHLPEPDLENITVLTHSLPNKPILPWNRYNSPWDETETETEENSHASSEEE